MRSSDPCVRGTHAREASRRASRRETGVRREASIDAGGKGTATPALDVAHAPPPGLKKGHAEILSRGKIDPLVAPA